MISIAHLAVSAIVPSIILIWYFHRRDVFPEPAHVLWKTFGLGVAITVPVAVIAWPLSDLAESIASPLAHGFVNAFLAAAIPEELLKFAVLWWYAARHFEFDEPMDGVVYGVAASLGFATLENVLYVAEGGASTALLRAVTAVPCHAFWGAIMGYYVGRAKFPEEHDLADSPATVRSQLTRALLVPILLHGLYDWPLLAAHRYEDGSAEPAFYLLLLGVPLLLISQAVWAIKTSRKLRRAQHGTMEFELPATGTETFRPAAPPPPPPVPPAPVAESLVEKPPARPGSFDKAIAWLALVLGGLLASLGGLLVLALVLGSLFVGLADEDVLPTVVGTIVLGVPPLIVGLLLFRWGLARLNRSDQHHPRAPR